MDHQGSPNWGLFVTTWASLVAETVKNLVRSLGWEYPLEKEMATHPSILAWRIPQTEKPGKLKSMGSQGAGHD